MRKLIVCTLLAVIIGVLGACQDSPKVIQGTVVSFDSASKTVVIRDECAPHEEIALSLSKAEIGAEPQTQDVVRVVYLKEGDRLNASRLMNLSRQKEVTTKGKQTTHKKCPKKSESVETTVGNTIP